MICRGENGNETVDFLFATAQFLVRDFPGPALTAGKLAVPCKHDS